MYEHLTVLVQKENGFPEFVDFEWYVPGSSTDFTSAEKAVQMVCRGGFHSSLLAPLTEQNPVGVFLFSHWCNDDCVFPDSAITFACMNPPPCVYVSQYYEAVSTMRRCGFGV